MRSESSKWIVVLFWAATIGGCIASEYSWQAFDLFFKPLLMPLLMSWMILETIPSRRPLIILFGLVFSWFGDMLLMFDREYPICFILGLASFLITHILYTIYFFRQKNSKRKNTDFTWALPVFGYAVLLVNYLYPKLGDLKIPVLVYALVISCMLFSTLIFPKISGVKTFLVAGALWFVVSDSLLAVNKFAFELPFASTLIRLSYSLAQFLIIAAIIRYRNNSTAVNLGI